MSDKFPVAVEDFLLGTAALLAEEGLRTEVRVVASEPFELEQTDYDNWNGGQYGWTITWFLPLKTFSMFTEEDRSKIEDRIGNAMKRVIQRYDSHSVRAQIAMAIPKAEGDWRQRARRWADGEGTTNQGRARSDNLAPLEHDGLLFRSRPEINLYSAFKALGIAVAPLPVFIRGGQNFRRIEPDFVLVYGGALMVVEVDGDEFHQETPAEAHQRLAMLSREGVKTERVFASDCETPDKARACAQKLFEILKRQAPMR